MAFHCVSMINFPRVECLCSFQRLAVINNSVTNILRDKSLHTCLYYTDEKTEVKEAE